MRDDHEKRSPWDLIDAVPVVNLDQRPERWAQFLENAEGLIPEEKLTRFSASYGIALPGYGEKPWFRGLDSDSRWGARAGCTLSHQRIMEAATEKGWETILILEDDADFSDTTPEELNAALSDVLTDQDWDVCYLGFSKTRGPSRLVGKIGDRQLFSISGAATTHAYLVRMKARDWIRDKLPTQENVWKWTARHRIIDRWYSWNMSLDLRVLAISPSIITQAEGFSDIVGGSVDYAEEFPGKVMRESNSALAYLAGRMRWRLQGWVTYVHDSIRYMVKRVNGF